MKSLYDYYSYATTLALLALFYVILKEVLAVRLVELHLLIFGVLFILVVLFLPGGLVEAWSRVRRLLSAKEG